MCKFSVGTNQGINPKGKNDVLIAIGTILLIVMLILVFMTGGN